LTIFEIGENKGMLIMTFSDDEAAAKVQNLRPEDRQEIRESHKLIRMEGETVFFIEK
tara:strand:+ start:509 stop:679 length:171 start_codon:yes stop_codon:yes gene_type:complete